MVQQAQKSLKTGLTASGKREARKDALDCFDEMTAHRWALQTLAGLLALAEAQEEPIPPELVGYAGQMMVRELSQMRDCTRRLEELALPLQKAQRGK